MGLTLALIGAAVLIRERFGSYWASPIDVLVLGETFLAFSLSLNQGADRLSALLLGFAALFYTVVLYQRRQRWLFLPLVFAVLALPILFFSRPYIALMIGALLPFVAVAIRRIMSYKTWAISGDTATKSGRVTIWEWPPLAVGLLYGAVAGLIDVLVSQYGGLSQSIVGSWLGVTFPVALELAASRWHGTYAPHLLGSNGGLFLLSALLEVRYFSPATHSGFWQLWPPRRPFWALESAAALIERGHLLSIS